ncbi:MAG: hypothetical protein ACTSSG_11355 [Candidatus Heimdallarchaeaceae archaeon]
MTGNTLVSDNGDEHTYADKHRILCKDFIEELKATYRKYDGKIANHYLSYLAQAIKEIQEANESILVLLLE